MNSNDIKPSFLNNSNKVISIDEIAEKIEKFSKDNLVLFDLEQYYNIFQLKFISKYEFDLENKLLIINYGVLKINYYDFYIKELNLFDDAKFLKWFPNKKFNTKYNQFESYYISHMQFINIFIKNKIN